MLQGMGWSQLCVYSSGGSGGGGVQGVRTPPPLLGHNVGFLTLGPKLAPPPFFACRPKTDPSGGSRVCVCDRGDHPAPPPWNVDDVTRAMSKGGCACECPRVGVFFKFSEGGWRNADNVQGGVLVKNPVSAPGPPFQKSWIRAWILTLNLVGCTQIYLWSSLMLTWCRAYARMMDLMGSYFQCSFKIF